MAKPRIPNQKKQYQLLNRRLAAYMAAVRRIYGELGSEAARIAASTGYDGKKPFAWKDYPRTKARVQQLQERFVSQLGSLIMSGTSDEWRRSNLHQDLIVDKVLKAYHTSRKDARNERYYRDNSEALQAFQQRKERGMNLSDKLWDQSQAYREELQDVISAAIERGTDSITLSKQVSKYLQDFPSMQRDYKELYGKASKVQNCEYRSIRLARSEINMAYRTAEQQRWRQLDFVVGYEIKMSGAHPAHDVCDELDGKYPKDFKWNGWHPNCYTDKAMVLTNNGWKHFSDVESTDAILSLNPDTRDVEWVKFVARQCYPYSGKMIRFFNKSLECVVTPEHQMVYLSKTKGDIRRISAIDYRKGNGAFYRTCEHRNPEEKQSIEINGDVWSFDDYCEFMGYWLEDGSTQHTTGVSLCQKKGEQAWDGMISCLERLGYHYTINEETISFYRSNIVRYLKQFGNAYNKFIPAEILSASKRQMQIFLDAFIKCDGYTRKTKSFVGNRGNVFSSKNDERMYFTTSPHLAGDLCQLLIMLGKRPSFKIKEPVTITNKDGSIIKGNYPCFVISECLSGTATVFDKEMVDYSGNVYDLTLEKNHIMYISYDGKCFWGSNCMCYEVPILKTEDEFYSENPDLRSWNEVADVPEAFNTWVGGNLGKIKAAEKNGTLPYFLADNNQYLAKAKEEFKEWEQFTSIIDVYKYAGKVATENMFYVNLELEDLYEELTMSYGQQIDRLEEEVQKLEELLKGSLGERTRIIYLTKKEQIEKKMDQLVYEKEHGEFTAKAEVRGFNSITKEGYNKSVLRDFDLFAFDDKIVSVGDEYEIYWRLKNVMGSKSATIRYGGVTESGESVSLERGFLKTSNGDIVVRHNLFELPEELQGKGISKKVMRACFEEYEKMGVTRVEVCANIDVGGLTWAKYGFYGERDEIEAIIKNRQRKGLITQEEAADALSIVREYEDYVPMQLLGYAPYGGKLLLGTKWQGHINLKDAAQMDYLHKYLRMSK